MPDLLLELLSEEIPARMQTRAAEDLRKLVTDALVERGFLYEGAQAFSTPRRLALHVVGLPARGRDVREERKGPRLGAPEAALAGFLKSAGVSSVDELTVQSDPKKGEFYVAVVERTGRATIDVLAEILPEIIRTFPWPKSMRWGSASAEAGSLRWVRPLQSILAAFGSDVETPEIVPFSVGGVSSGDETRGHRFMAPARITVRRFDDYIAALADAKVVLDAARRRDIIRHDARDLAFAQGLEVVDDEGLVEEVAGLVEWPVVLMGSFDESFLAVPPEAIRATIRANQKCFVLRRADGLLANRFIPIANIEARDGGAAIVAGNERVVRARLADAKFFWDTDRAVPLETRGEKLRSIVFHEKLGRQGERVERVAALARELAPAVGADPERAERAANLAKADLVTEMVGEFPELQGLMGRYYASAQGEDPAVAAAIADHYKPLGPADQVPTDPVSVAVALADKLDTLVGFWAIDEKPTGSKDPYALRRAALGVIRLVLENGLKIGLSRHLHDQFRIDLLERVKRFFATKMSMSLAELSKSQLAGLVSGSDLTDDALAKYSAMVRAGDKPFDVDSFPIFDLLAFFHDRLKVYLRDRGARHDLIDAVLGGAARRAKDDARRGGAASNDDLLAIVRRVEALGRLLDTADGANLLAGTKRAGNILRIEEKKDAQSYGEAPDPALFGLPEERALAGVLDTAEAVAAEAVARDDYEGAMSALAELRPAVDAFFDKVTVNDPDPALRANRLRLLARLRDATRAVADFSKIEG